jgi:hypothetical protein
LQRISFSDAGRSDAARKFIFSGATVMRSAKAASARRPGKIAAVSLARAGLAGLALAVALGPAAGATLGQSLTCQELEKKCLAHAVFASPPPRSTGKAQSKLPEDQPPSRERCHEKFTKALASGFWPGHHGSANFRCNR